MTPAQFVAELDETIVAALAHLSDTETLENESDGRLNIPTMLKIALKNEIEATELAAVWMPTTPEIDVKLGLARQSGDEAKHYSLIQKRLGELGVDLSSFYPLATGYSPLFQFLAELHDTVERLAAGPFAREAIAQVRNEQFIKYCDAVGDPATASLYRDIIQPDERYHHELGRTLLQKYATEPGDQDRARRAVAKTLEIADELRQRAVKKTGLPKIPGC